MINIGDKVLIRGTEITGEVDGKFSALGNEYILLKGSKQEYNAQDAYVVDKAEEMKVFESPTTRTAIIAMEEYPSADESNPYDPTIPLREAIAQTEELKTKLEKLLISVSDSDEQDA